MNLIRQVVKWTLTAALPRTHWLVNGPRTLNGIALTFDDGPHPDYTPRILDELDQCQIRATFFVVGQAAEVYPDIIRRIVSAGHALGTHTYTHSEPGETPAAKLLDETRRTTDLMADLTGQQPTLFRPPKGKLTLQKTLGLWRLGQTIVLWNQDPRDYCADPRHGISEWIETYRPRSGDIVLLHDTHPHCIPAIAGLAERVTGGFRTIHEMIGQEHLTPELQEAITASGVSQ